MRKMAMSICLGTAILFMASMTVPNVSIGFSHDSIIGAAKKQYKKAKKTYKKAKKTYKKAKKTVKKTYKKAKKTVKKTYKKAKKTYKKAEKAYSKHQREAEKAVNKIKSSLVNCAELAAKKNRTKKRQKKCAKDMKALSKDAVKYAKKGYGPASAAMALGVMEAVKNLGNAKKICKRELKKLPLEHASIFSNPPLFLLDPSGMCAKHFNVSLVCGVAGDIAKIAKIGSLTKSISKNYSRKPCTEIPKYLPPPRAICATGMAAVGVATSAFKATRCLIASLRMGALLPNIPDITLPTDVRLPDMPDVKIPNIKKVSLPRISIPKPTPTVCGIMGELVYEYTLFARAKKLKKLKGAKMKKMVIDDLIKIRKVLKLTSKAKSVVLLNQILDTTSECGGIDQKKIKALVLKKARRKARALASKKGGKVLRKAKAVASKKRRKVSRKARPMASKARAKIKKGKRSLRRKKRFAKKLGRKSVERQCAKKFRRNRKKMKGCIKRKIARKNVKRACAKRFRRNRKKMNDCINRKIARGNVKRACAKRFRRNRKKMNDCRVRGMKGLPGFGTFELAKRNLRKIKSPGQLKRCNPNPAEISSVNKCSNRGLLSSGSSVRISSVVRRKKSGQRGIWCKVTVLNAASQSQVPNGARGWVRRNKIRNPSPKGC